MTTTKKIEWACPTSSNAVKFGFGKTGCYTVEFKEAKNKPAKAVAGFATIDEAETHAACFSYEWDKYTRRAKTENLPTGQR